LNQVSASSFGETPAGGSNLAARQSFRAFGRRLQRDSNNVALHGQRLVAALALDGAEPVQGALVDFFFACTAADTAVRCAALEQVRHRLNPLIAQVFETHLGSNLSLTSSRIATRWSIFVSPSLDVPRRALRCSADDSRAFAKTAIAAWHSKDEATQQAFLEHCLICKDTLAYMLARRVILQHQNTLPVAWSEVGHQLEQAVLAV
jgi:hypothetical protein